MSKYKASDVKAIFYVPSPQIRLSDMANGSQQSIITKNHGGSLEQAKNLNNFLAPVDKWRLVQDVLLWRESIREAEKAILPYRFGMQLAFMDTVLDPHIRACLDRRENLTLLRKFEVVDQSEKVNEQWTNYLNKPWFKTYMRYTLGAKWYGYTLISLGDFDNNIPINIAMIPRTHISPDRLVVSSIPKAPSGEKFLEEPYKSSHIWVSTPSEHGLNACGYGILYELTMLAIGLRNNLNYNIEFAEVFGMPFRQLKSDKSDIDNMNKMQSALEDMGSLGYMITGKDDELVFHDTNKGSGYKIYESLEVRLEKKVSKILLGHSDGLDSTKGALGAQQGAENSPQAQALIDITSSDGEFIMDQVNNNLIPHLRMNNVNFPSNLHFRFKNDNEEKEIAMFENDQNLKISEAIMNLAKGGYVVDIAYIEEKMGYKLSGLQAPEASNDSNSPEASNALNVINSKMGRTHSIIPIPITIRKSSPSEPSEPSSPSKQSEPSSPSSPSKKSTMQPKVVPVTVQPTPEPDKQEVPDTQITPNPEVPNTPNVPKTSKPKPITTAPDEPVADIPMHPNCKCELINNEWVTMEGACGECVGASEAYNNYINTGDIDNALNVYMSHTGKNIINNI